MTRNSPERTEMILRWRASIAQLNDNHFFELMRMYLGEIQTPFNKQKLIEALGNFLHKEEVRQNAALLISPGDIRILTAVQFMDNPTTESLTGLFSGSITCAELHETLMNLEERLLLFQYQPDSSGHPVYAINPLLQDIILPRLSVAVLLPPAAGSRDVADTAPVLTPQLLAAFFDGIDGKVARIVNGSSDFGVQLDSLCDMVSFGVAPAILVYEWLLKGFDRVGIVAVFLFVACGALRLARFNVQSGKISNVYFVGLPIPAAAAFIATSVLFIHKLGLDLEKAALSMFFLVSIYLLAFLMVSTVPFFSFKKMSYFKARPFQALIVMVIFISILVLYFEVVSFIMITAYITIVLLFELFNMIKCKTKKLEEKQQEY